MGLTLTSTAFAHGAEIPSQSTGLEEAMAGHVLASAELLETYERSS
jgi:phosphatidylethanolamine-binding protein (PEBP) family uncharacterized protein